MKHIDLETLHKEALAKYNENAVHYVFDGLMDLDDLPYVRADINRDRAQFYSDELGKEEHEARVALVDELSALRKSGVVAKWSWAKKVWSYA